MKTALRDVVLATLLGASLLAPVFGRPLVAAAVWVGCLVLLARSHPAGALSLSFLYLLLLGIFHLGLVVPAAVGAGPERPPSWLLSRHLPTALSLFSTAAIAFTLGSRPPPIPQEEAAALPTEPHLFLVGGLVAAIGAAMLWVGISQVGVFGQEYSAYFERALTEDVRLFGFGLMLFPIGLLVAAVGATRGQLWVLGAAHVVVLGPIFLGGFRGPAIVQTTALLAVWARKSPRTARRLALVSAVLIAILVPTIRAARDREDTHPADRGTAALSMFFEAGGSVHPLIITAERIGSGAERLWLGRSYRMAVERLTLNVARRWSAPGARTLTPSTWATFHGDFWAFEHGGGVGFSGVAEPYLNFGVPGLVLFFVLLGAVMSRWERWLAGVNPFRAAVGAATFGFVLWTVRNDSLELLRAAALASLTVLAAWVWQHFRRKGRLESAARLDA